jgi:hypothetical protein
LPDLEHVRRRCRSLSLEELLGEALLQAEDYMPEARQVLQEELAQRVGDLKSYLAGYEQAVGETLARADGVKNFGRTSERYTGTLLLTTKGIGFSPTGRDEDPLIAPDSISAVLSAALADKFSEAAEAGRAAARPHLRQRVLGPRAKHPDHRAGRLGRLHPRERAARGLGPDRGAASRRL